MFICGKELNTIYIYTSIPFTSNIHTSRSCRISFGVQQLHSSCAFIEVIFEGDAAVPGLDFTAASP